MTKRSKFLLPLLAPTALLSVVPVQTAQAGYRGLPRTFIRNPGTTQLVDTTAIKKEPPHRIGWRPWLS